MSQRERKDESLVAKIVDGVIAVGVGVAVLGAISAFLAPAEEEAETVRVGSQGRRRVDGDIGRRYEKKSSSPTSSSDIDAWLAAQKGRLCSEVVSETSDLACKICFVHKISHVLECGHTVCQECAVTMLKSTRTCPFDRQVLTRAPQKMFV